jgi:hypothetical protein
MGGSGRVQREFITPVITLSQQLRVREVAVRDDHKSKGRLDMSSSRLALTATMMLLSMGFFLYPQGPANAAKFCAQLRGATATGHPDCSFSTLEACRARVRHRGGGHCYKLH